MIMELTGKAKKDFINFMCKTYPDIRWHEYETLPNSILNALIIEFFDSVGIYINTPPYYMKLEKYNRGFESIIIDEKSGKIYDLDNDEDVFNSRPEAGIEAIKKANKIYNQNY